MQTGSTIAAPRPVSQGTILRHHADSPFNSLGCRRASFRSFKTTATAATSTTKTHLANLERLLQTPPPPLPTPKPSKDPDPPTQGGGGGGGGGGLLHALNLPILFPFARKQPEENMSPRTLTRLLSDSSRHSPRGTIASRWRHYHGAADWAGLLDPLDENLRRELVRYGDLVQASYHAFHSNPTTKPEAPPTVSLPDRSYRVTRPLFATASVELPPWVDRLVDPLMTQRSSWIGYVAVCEYDNEIRRMGRRDIVIALRGTATCLEWAENLRAGLVPIDDGNGNDERNENSASRLPKVECGFWNLYKTAGDRVPSLSAAVVEEVRRLVNRYKGEELSITVTGHSLGAALAVLVADELSSSIPDAPPIAVFSFGGPRVGNRAFADRVEGRGVKVLRVVNAHDVVTRVPLGVAPAPVRPERRTGFKWLPAKVLERIDGYADIGRELRVDSQASPYLRPDADPACCHDLEAYLHLVDGFMGTNCPFRSNAKRSLARLLSQQGGNVKKLYTSKARELRVAELDLSATAGDGARCWSNVPGYLASPS